MFDMDKEYDIDLSMFSKKEIHNVTRKHLVLTRETLRTREDLEKYVLQEHNEDVLHDLQKLRNEKINEEQAQAAAKRKYKNDIRQEEHKRRRLEGIADEEDSTRYLELPTADEVKHCYRAFYNATGSAAVSLAVCSVCASEKLVAEAKFTSIPVRDVPNPHRLFPRQQHAAHDIYEGMLLEPQGIIILNDGEVEVRICRDCLKELRKDTDLAPPRSLANNLWVGKIPWQLSSLTLPEHILVAHASPRVYVYKLYPKSLNRHMDDTTYQQGMRGNVSTHALNVNAMADMVCGRMMPRPPSTLLSTISITIIGHGKLPKSYLRSLFRVRRAVVFEALKWLKINNPKYYGDIDISEERLQMLPEDDVPDEMLEIVRHSEDVGRVEEERSGYVNEDNEGERRLKSSWTRTEGL